MRLRTAVLTAVLAGSLAGPSVLNASAANRPHSVAATRAAASKELKKLKSLAADDSVPAADPIGVVESVISELEFDLSTGNLQAITWDFPGFGPY
jgi:hypothetical protein